MTEQPAQTTTAGDPATARGEQTRQLIRDTAMRLFRERGYAQTTMRAIAQEAGVAVGNAYYYFGSKDHLIQEFYAQSQVEHRAGRRSPCSTGRRRSPPGSPECCTRGSTC